MGKKWKDHLLSSGIPLEHDVKQILKKLAILAPKEYEFTRINQQGIPTTFSIDIYCSKVYGDLKLWLDLLIECKYRHDNVKWFFISDSFDTILKSGIPRDAFIVLDQLTDGPKINREYLNSFSKYYDLASRGIEILDKNHNPKGIREGIDQLRFGIVDLVGSALLHQINKSLGGKVPIWSIVPILLTTADLWITNPGFSMKKIRETENIEDIASKRDFLFLRMEPTNYLTTFSMKHLFEIFSHEQVARLETMYSTSKFLSYKGFINFFAYNYPVLFLIINFEHFEQTISQLFQFFGSSDMLQNE